jgi:hypothetical protein
VQSGIFRAVKAVFPDAIWEYRMENGKEIDIYVPSIKSGIEYNGNYYHSDAVQKDAEYHLKKTLAGLKEGGTAILHVLTEEAIEPYDNLVHTLKELAGPRSPTIPATPIETNIKFKVLGSVAAAEFHQRYNFRKLCTGYAACTYHVGMFTATGELLAVASAHLDETKDLFYILQLTLKDSRYTQAIPALSFATSELSGMSKYRFAVLASLCNPLEVFQILSALSQIPPKYTGPVPHWLDSSYKLDDNLTSENATARIWDAGYLVFLLR